MSLLEVVKVIKTRAENPQGMAEVFSDRVFVKSNDLKWKDFPSTVVSKAFIEEYERVKNFKVYDDDVWLVGFPRSGTTLVQELLWLIMNDYDFDGAKKADTYNRAQWFEYFNMTHKLQGVPIDYQDKMPRPRVFKTHLPVQFLPDQIWTVKPKLIYIKRDVKDVTISNFFLRQNTFHDDVQSMEEHFEDMLKDEAWYCPYREHVVNYKKIPDYQNLMYLTYEELMADKASIIKEIVKFLGKSISEEQLSTVLEHLKFDNMKKNKATNMSKYMELFNQISQHDRPTDNFIRKGIVGDHKNQMSDETIKRFDDWMAKSDDLKCGF